MRTTAPKRNFQTTFASNLEQHASMETTSRNTRSAAKEDTSVTCGIGLPLRGSTEQSFPIADNVGGSLHSNGASETTQPAHPQQNLQYFTESERQLPAPEFPGEAQQTRQQTFRGQHQPLQRHNLHHNAPRIRDYVENHFHTNATHANRAFEASTIPEIPIAQIREQNRKTPSQDHIAQPQNNNNATQRTFHRDSTNHTRISPAPQTSPHPQYAQASSTQQFPMPPHFSPGSGGFLASNHSYQLLEEARDIRFTGRKLPFIFYFKKITELLRRCSDPNRKMDLLRTFCQEQAREAVSALVPRIPGWAKDTQVDRALEGLRLRYGCCSFLSEPLVKKIRSGPKFNKMDVNALEQLLSELNDCKLYTSAYKQTSSLNNSFILDIAERLLFYFKTRYPDYLVDHCGNPDDPSFDTFKTFLSRELKRINTTFAQRLLGSAPKRSINTNTPQ